MVQGNLSLEVAFDAEPLDLSTLSFGNLVKRFAPASAILGRHDDKYLAKVQVVGKIFMREQIRAFLVRASARPVLMVYGSDLTRMLWYLNTGWLPKSTGDTRYARGTRLANGVCTALTT